MKIFFHGASQPALKRRWHHDNSGQMALNSTPGRAECEVFAVRLNRRALRCGSYLVSYVLQRRRSIRHIVPWQAIRIHLHSAPSRLMPDNGRIPWRRWGRGAYKFGSDLLHQHLILVPSATKPTKMHFKKSSPQGHVLSGLSQALHQHWHRCFDPINRPQLFIGIVC